MFPTKLLAAEPRTPVLTLADARYREAVGDPGRRAHNEAVPVTAAGTWTKCTDLHRVTSPDEHSASNRLRSAHGVSSRVVLDYPRASCHENTQPKILK